MKENLCFKKKKKKLEMADGPLLEKCVCKGKKYNSSQWGNWGKIKVVQSIKAEHAYFTLALERGIFQQD